MICIANYIEFRQQNIHGVVHTDNQSNVANLVIKTKTATATDFVVTFIKTLRVFFYFKTRGLAYRNSDSEGDQRTGDIASATEKLFPKSALSAGSVERAHFLIHCCF